MKVFKIIQKPSAHQLFAQLQERLNPLLQDKIQRDVELVITLQGDTIEIGQPQLYQSFLYRIFIRENEIQIIKSEDYIDDVYNLTLEDILNTLIVDCVGENNIETVQYSY